jgi:hypothetical protein
MAMFRLRRFVRDTRGVALAEFTVVGLFTLLVIGGLIDFFLAFWQWNAAMKAVERGARIAAVSDPVANVTGGWATLVADSASGANAGKPYPADGFVEVVCDGASASCSGPVAGYNATAMYWIVCGRGAATTCGGTNPCPAAGSAYSVGMCHLYWLIAPEKVKITYRATGLGYWSRSHGPIVTIELQLQNIQVNFLFLRGLVGAALSDIILGTAKATITSEDLCSNSGSITSAC